jgi:hypothetical protein
MKKNLQSIERPFIMKVLNCMTVERSYPAKPYAQRDSHTQLNKLYICLSQCETGENKSLDYGLFKGGTRFLGKLHLICVKLLIPNNIL